MHIPYLVLASLAFIANTKLAFAGSPPPDTSGCGVCGVIGGQCVNYFQDQGCDNKSKIGRFCPTGCDKTCYTVEGGFSSLYICGDGTYGTCCNAYSDDNCQDLLGWTPNIIFATDPGCSNFPGIPGKSFKCYWACN